MKQINIDDVFSLFFIMVLFYFLWSHIVALIIIGVIAYAVIAIFNFLAGGK